MRKQGRPSCAEIFTAFLRLGTTAFGGPVAHLEHFRREFVERRQWLDAARFGQLLAICQALPGPASSQLGFTIGLLRGGACGALAAFAGFTLPSAVLLFVLGRVGGAWPGPAVAHGLGLVAVSLVAHAVVRMAQSLTPDARRRGLALAAMVAALAAGSAWAQLAVIAGGAVLGAVLCGREVAGPAATIDVPYGSRATLAALFLFVGIVAVALGWPAGGAASLASLAAAFVRAGSLVFGGGHVVLPLLDASLVQRGWLAADPFLAGYGAAQAVPGPLFAVAAWLGAAIPTGAPAAVGALVALVALFTPGFLLVVAVLPAWSRLRALPRAGAVLAGINAAVVGLLAAALYDPIVTSAVRSVADAGVAGLGLLFLLRTRRSPLWVVGWCLAAALALG
jgi:chromate transporter